MCVCVCVCVCVFMLCSGVYWYGMTVIDINMGCVIVADICLVLLF